jgi:predicted DNA-binding protein
MEIQLPPEDQVLLADLAQRTGRSEVEIVQEIMGSYLRGVEEVREMLDRRLDDLERGRVKPHTPDQLWENLERRKTAYLQQRS